MKPALFFLEARSATEGFLFGTIAVLLILGMVAVSRWFNRRDWTRIGQKQLEKERAKQAEKIGQVMAYAEKRKRFVDETLLPAYYELLRNGPIGYWSDPRDMYNRVVTYEDWEFRADGTGDHIFFTVGSGVTRSPFTWTKTGERQLLLKAVLQLREAEEEGETATYENEGSLPDEQTLAYDFEARETQVCLVRNGYTSEKPVTGRIDILWLERGDVKQKLEQLEKMC
jgi:hypothetical protein